jgi:UDP-N-acetylmuramoyl-tripeptide--D-alanyl-D-alanine ligase
MVDTAFTLAAAAAATGGRLAAGPSDARFSGVSIDSRTLLPGQLFVAIAGPRFDGHEFLAEAARAGAAAAMVHREVAAPPGLPRLLVGDTTRALSDLGRHARAEAAAAVVAITGSVGKTTTKDMTAALLARRGPVLKTEGNLNNQYGLPLTLLRLRPEHRFAVLELGMSAAGELRALSAVARPDVAVITLVAPVHLEFFASVEAIAAAKAEILEGLVPGGVAVLNGDDPHLRRIGEAHRGQVVWFGRDRAFQVSAENWRGTVHGMRFDLRLAGRSLGVALPLAGPHHLTNFLAAAAAAHQLGLTPDEIAEGAVELRPARHRGEVVRLREGVTLLDDCYNSNPVAVEAAVTALGLAARGRRVAVLGDMRELGASAAELHRRTGEAVGAKLDLLVAVGELAEHFLEGGRQAGLGADALQALPDAAAAAAAVPGLLRAGDAVLVKGSRGVKLESVVEAVIARFGREGG